MRRAGLFALLTSAAGLAILVALEFRTTRPAMVTAPAPVAALPAIAGQPTSQFPRDAAETAAILARPLFDPTRHPSGKPASAPARSTPVSLPRLTGIVVDGRRRTAIFQSGGEERSVAVAEGGSLGGYRVETIGSRDVVISGQDGAHTLRLKFTPQSASGTSPSKAAPVEIPAGGLPPFNGPPGLSAMPKFVPQPVGDEPQLNLGGIPGLPPLAAPGR